MKKLRTLALIPALMLILSVCAFAAEATPEEYADKFGFVTLLPAIVALILAYFTKNLIFSLLMGIFTGGYLLSINGINILGSVGSSFNITSSEIVQQLTLGRNAGIILQCLMITGLVALITRNGGASALARKVSAAAKTPAMAQIAAFFMGIIVFVDDYATALMTGPVMRPITDKMKVSREKLAFIIDATAAPVAGLALISTWIIYEVSIIRDAYMQLGLEVNAYSVFIQTLPYRFYSILIIALVVMTALANREFGPMLKAEVRSRGEGKLLADNARPLVFPAKVYAEPEKQGRSSRVLFNALIPLAILIVSSLIGFYINGKQQIMSGIDDGLIQSVMSTPFAPSTVRDIVSNANAPMVLFQAAFLACIAAAAMGVTQRRFNISGAVDTWLAGIRSNINTAIVLLLSWTMASLISKLGGGIYAAGLLKSYIPNALVPAAVFLVSAMAAFACSNVFAAMSVMMPVAVSFSVALTGSVDHIPLVIAAVLTGVVFGINCSPIADITILCSMGAMSDHLHHIRTQVPYALLTAAVALGAGFIPMGYGMSVYIALPLCIALLFAFLMIFGKTPERVAGLAMQGAKAVDADGIKLRTAGKASHKALEQASGGALAKPPKTAPGAIIKLMRLFKPKAKKKKTQDSVPSRKAQAQGSDLINNSSDNTETTRRKIDIVTYDFKQQDLDDKRAETPSGRKTTDSRSEQENSKKPWSERIKEEYGDEAQLSLNELSIEVNARQAADKDDAKARSAEKEITSELEEILKQLDEMDKPRRAYSKELFEIEDEDKNR